MDFLLKKLKMGLLNNKICMRLIKMGFKEQLTKLRKRNNMTQTDLAKLMDVKQYVISSWEIGRSEPTISQLKMLSNIFKISVDYLLDKEFIGSCNEEEFNNAIKNVKMDAEDVFLNEVIKECGKLSEDKKKKMLNIIKASLEFEK
jgi:transcriptional regulator with XRE-family HTH domain